MKNLRRASVLIGLLAIIIISCFTVGYKAFEGDDNDEDPQVAAFLKLDSHTDDFKFGGHIIDSIDEEEIFKKEKNLDDEYKKTISDRKAKDLFEKVCPSGYYKCLNGECISPKWRCDGHFDCDDFSDELNCTIIEIPATSDLDFSHPVKSSSSRSKPSPPQLPAKKEEIGVITFNSSQEPLMLFSTGTSIRGYWMKSSIYFNVFGMSSRQLPKNEPSSITSALSIFFDFLNAEQFQTSSKADELALKAKNTIVGLDMNPNNKEVFWVELGQDAGVYSTAISSDQFESRYRRQFSGPERKTIVDSGLISPEDIALDTLGRNLYITDAGLPAIVVCSIKKSHCKIIVKDKLHKPRAIIADSSTGWLMYTDWGDHPGIYSVSMDGRRRETLIDSDVVWPNGLAADYAANHLYWADARLSKIERVDLTTMERRRIIKESTSNPFSLSLFENRIYWSDWSGNNIRTCEKSTGNDTKAIMRADSIYGIHIYHPSLDRAHDMENPCWSKYCSHMCLLSPSTSFAKRNTRSVNAACSCPESMALSIGDHATCYEVQLSFLLVNVKNYIAQVFPEQIGLSTVQKVLYSSKHIIHDVASDWLNYRLFFFDAVKQHIYSAELSKKDVKINQFLEDKTSVRGLLYDSWSDNLYWLETDQGTMSMCSVKAKYETVMRKDLEQPISLALDSKNRVFYIALLGSTPHIMRTDIMGREESDLMIINNDIGLPVAIHLDEQMQRLYWADARFETIESLDLDIKSKIRGVKAHSRIHHKGRLGTILAFTVYHDYFLWMNKNDDYLYKAKIDDNPVDPRQVSFRLPPNPSNRDPSSDNKRIIVVDPRREVISSPCLRAGCSHGCVVNANFSSICVCPNGYKIQANNKTNCKLEEKVASDSTTTTPAGDVLHNAVAHIEIPHMEEAKNHLEEPHTDDEANRKHVDVHIDLPHLDLPQLDAHHLDDGSHSSSFHLSASPHIDTPHVDSLHIDTSHIQANHLDIPHDTAEPPQAQQQKQQQQQQHQTPRNEPLSDEVTRIVEPRIEDAESSLTWLILLLLLLVMAGLITLASILFIFKPRHMSHLLVGFRSHHDKEGAVVLLDD